MAVTVVTAVVTVLLVVADVVVDDVVIVVQYRPGTVHLKNVLQALYCKPQSLKEGRSDECRCADHKVTTRMKSDANTTERKNMPARTSPGQTRSAIPAEQSGLGR